MAFFSGMGGGTPGAPGPAAGGGGMDPQMLAMIFRMMQGGGGAGGMGGAQMPGGPQLSAPPQVGTVFHGGAAPLGAGPQQGNPMLTQLMQNPQMLQQLLAMIGGGGMGMNSPIAGTGGLTPAAVNAAPFT
jgi:ubiquilin